MFVIRKMIALLFLPHCNDSKEFSSGSEESEREREREREKERERSEADKKERERERERESPGAKPLRGIQLNPS